MITEQFLLKHQLRKIESLKLRVQTYHVTHFNHLNIQCTAFVHGDKPEDYITFVLTQSGAFVVIGPHSGPRYNREVFHVDTEQEVLEWIRGEREVAYYVQT